MAMRKDRRERTGYPPSSPGPLGIGAATARQLAAEGTDVVIGARRSIDSKLSRNEIGARFAPLDVTDDVGGRLCR
jgi:NAD(P)-dependent dehydrogenase (short-subunit alcohol dehydrogenase family)